MLAVDTEAATKRLMRFLAVEGVTGQEAMIGKELVAALREAGVPARCIRFDDAHTRISLPTETGNLIVDLPGRGALASADRLLFMTHMDTVPLCAGAKPKRQGRKIVNAAKTALGGDNRTGCAVLVTLAAELLRHKPDHPPLTLLFTVREESGLWGARYVEPQGSRAASAMGFNYDGRKAADVVIGAVGADRWEVEIFGRASHAGGAPERGISATMILAEALVAVRAGGWFGKVEKDGRSGTSNIGPVGGANDRPAGDATNVVTDYVLVQGESRSHDAKFVREITRPTRRRSTNAAAGVKDSERQGRPREVHEPHRLLPLPAEGDRAGGAARGGRRCGAGPHAQRARHQRRPRRQLDGAPRHPDRDVRRRPERGSHGRRMDRPRRVRGGLPARLRAGDHGVTQPPACQKNAAPAEPLR